MTVLRSFHDGDWHQSKFPIKTSRDSARSYVDILPIPRKNHPGFVTTGETEMVRRIADIAGMMMTAAKTGGMITRVTTTPATTLKTTTKTTA
ncbi:hypothetical protein [Roseibium litorale]|uniref:Uncharacterized protein n=1 Tax=Roseibium litorale TaxID=2803841 RepID=A0ABR9CMF9_9HYPH|nr:hypothetical protein [Roseibium litorale]MBD8892037.1 hypothetical protein [Roseibium litorale]